MAPSILTNPKPTYIYICIALGFGVLGFKALGFKVAEPEQGPTSTIVSSKLLLPLGIGPLYITPNTRGLMKGNLTKKLAPPILGNPMYVVHPKPLTLNPKS